MSQLGSADLGFGVRKYSPAVSRPPGTRFNKGRPTADWALPPALRTTPTAELRRRP